MAGLNKLELQNLRHLIGGHGTVAVKLDFYAQQCQDPNIKQTLQQHAQDARASKEKLLSFLQ